MGGIIETEQGLIYSKVSRLINGPDRCCGMVLPISWGRGEYSTILALFSV